MAKIGALHRVTNSSGGHVEMYPITSVSAIPDFEITVAARLAANTIFKTAAQWSSAGSTVLRNGQFGYETDTKYAKIGDGSTTYANLPYVKSPVNPDNIIRKTAAAWVTAGSTVLLAGQIGYETDSHYMKIGDGTTTYANLSYVMTPTTTVELKSGNTTTTNDTITLTIS